MVIGEAKFNREEKSPSPTRQASEPELPLDDRSTPFPLRLGHERRSPLHPGPKDSSGGG